MLKRPSGVAARFGGSLGHTIEGTTDSRNTWGQQKTLPPKIFERKKIIINNANIHRRTHRT